MKEKNIKRILLTALSAFFVASATAGVATLSAKADGKEIIAAGASVRVKFDENNEEEAKYNGIRFATYLKGVSLADIQSSTAYIIPNDLLDGMQELDETTVGVNVKDTTSKWYEYTDKEYGNVLCSNVVLYDINLASYTRNITVETTVILNDGTTLSTDYKSENYKGTRSLDWVAEQALVDTDDNGNLIYAEGTNEHTILRGYDVTPAEEGTYVDFEDVTLSAAKSSMSVTASPAYWSNYYKDYNTLSLSVTVNGTVSDVTELKYVSEDGATTLNIPLVGLTANIAKQVVFDYDHANDYGIFTNGTFEATVTGDTTITIAPMVATKLTAKNSNAMYAYSREDHELRMDYSDFLKKNSANAADVLAVKYEGSYVAYTLDTENNDIVFAEDIMSETEDLTAKTLEIYTATAKYTLTKLMAHTKVFYEADDLFVTYDNGTTYYSYFDMSVDDDRFEPFTEGTAATGLAAKGTYALGADIDLSQDSRVLWHANPQQTLSGSDFNKNGSTWIGLTGNFYGYAHTITGMTVGRGGFFGHIGRGTVRDVSFKNVKYSTQANKNMDQYASILAYAIGGYGSNGPTFENLHISVATVQTGAYYATKSEITNDVTETAIYGYASILAYRVSTAKAASFKNVVVDLSAFGDQVNVMGFGLFGEMAVNTMTSAYSNMQNVFVISSGGLYIGHDNKKTNGSTRLGVIYDAANKQDVTWVGTNVAFIAAGAVYNVTVDTVSYLTEYTSLYRFSNAQEMKEYIAANDVDITAFDGKSGWTIENGIPEWN